MTNHEIEKLAKEYCHQYLNDAFRIEPYFSKATDDNEYIITQSFKAGYLKGVEKAIEICELYMNPNNKFVAEIFDVKEALEQLLSSEGEK